MPTCLDLLAPVRPAGRQQLTRRACAPARTPRAQRRAGRVPAAAPNRRRAVGCVDASRAEDEAWHARPLRGGAGFQLYVEALAQHTFGRRTILFDAVVGPNRLRSRRSRSDICRCRRTSSATMEWRIVNDIRRSLPAVVDRWCGAHGGIASHNRDPPIVLAPPWCGSSRHHVARRVWHVRARADRRGSKSIGWIPSLSRSTLIAAETIATAQQRGPANRQCRHHHHSHARSCRS